MNGSWPKIVRDPVHSLIAFEDTPCDRLLRELINTKEFQRLRRIRQLGMSQYVFPGADHTRFAHSIGVMQNSRRFLDRLQRIAPEHIDDDRRCVVTVAALLHDLGHGPFSHTFEKITGEDHEQRTLEIIKDPSTEVHQTLIGYQKELPNRLAVFFDENVEDSERDGANVPAFLTQVVSSQLDADRFDYLIRDSRSTGVDYGAFDDGWLIQHLQLDEKPKRFFLSHKALTVAEAYVFARHHMYRTVYFHKTTRAAEVMLRLLFSRYKELVKGCSHLAQKVQVAPGVPGPVFLAFANSAEPAKSMSLGQYLDLDDHAITEFQRACLRSEDRVLQELAGGLLHRKLYKARDVTGAEPTAIGNFVADCREKLTGMGKEKDYAWADDSPSDTPYKPYDPDDAHPATQIYVNTLAHGPKELSTLSDAVAQLRKKYTLVRYYFPESVRSEIDAIGDNRLGKGIR